MAAERCGFLLIPRFSLRACWPALVDRSGFLAACARRLCEFADLFTAVAAFFRVSDSARPFCAVGESVALVRRGCRRESPDLTEVPGTICFFFLRRPKPALASAPTANSLFFFSSA